jgi:hypothetical protein
VTTLNGVCEGGDSAQKTCTSLRLDKPSPARVSMRTKRVTTSNGAEARTRSPKGGSKTGGAAHTPSNRSPSSDVESANVSLESPCSTAERMRVFSPKSKTTIGPVPRRWSVSWAFQAVPSG